MATKFKLLVEVGRAVIRFRTWLLVAVLAGSAVAIPQAHALTSSPVESPRVTATLLSESASVAPGQTFRLGLRQKLAPGWHTYWKNPGDAGIATEIKLTLPDGASAGTIDWPGPDRFSVGPVTSFGYENDILLPLSVTVPQSVQPGQTFPVVAEAEWLVCEKICIPESGTFRLDIPISATPVPADAPVKAAFAAAEARKPIVSPWSGRVYADGETLGLVVEGEGLSPASVSKAFYYAADWGAIAHAAEQKISIEPGRLVLAIEKGQFFNPQAPMAGLLAVTDGGGAVRWFDMAPAVTVAPLPFKISQPALAGGLPLPLWQTALFALIGGLILNLMPCVFPVLAIKATAVASLSGGALREVRLASVFYTLGVLVTFLALASLLLAVRAAGVAVGWGFQFQSPIFVAVMAWLLLAIGLNLSGVYEIGLTVSNTGQTLARRSGHAGSFFTGILAVVVATPCTAPFMGAAIGAALAAPAVVCLVIFLFLGLGMATPYALLGIFPQLARALPRPGPWMVRLRQGMAFPMYASAAWLVWVLSRQAGDFGLMVALVGALLVGLAAWSLGIAQHHARRGLIPRSVAVAALVGILALLVQLNGVAAPGAVASTTPQSSDSEPFSSSRLAALRQEGRPVFVNMTAAWCITCLVNERTALSTDAVREAFRSRGIVYLKGDWTNRDQEITDYLRSFNRDGLPFYAFYPAGGRDPVVLPPVLTEGMVVGEIDRHAR